jgi:hypothetical protein
MLMSATLPAKSSCSGPNSFFQEAADGGTADLQPATNFGFADARPVELTHLVGVEASGHRPPQALAVLASVRQTGPNSRVAHTSRCLLSGCMRPSRDAIFRCQSYSTITA